MGAADVVPHLLPLGIVDDGEVLLAHGEDVLLGDLGAAEHVVFHAVDCGDVCAGVDSPPLQNLSADRTGKAEGRCQTAGEMSAATHVIEATVAHGAGIVGVTRTGQPCQIAVVLGTCVRILDKGTQRCASGAVVQKTGHHLRQVFFATRRCRPVFFRGTACHKVAQLFKVDILAGGEIIDHHTDGGAVRFSENRNGNITIPER